MPREAMMTFIKKSLIGAICVATVSAGVSMICMLLTLDKAVALLDYKVTYIMKYLAPEATNNPVAKQNP